ncbi:MAG TPA: cardiolipin synthase, partial [Dorea longicatena]|nr:cardiolipin synthase [Dorea longicatena]
LEGKKKTQNGVKRLMFTVLSILLEVVFLVGIFKGLNEYAVVIDNMTRIFAVI